MATGRGTLIPGSVVAEGGWKPVVEGRGGLAIAGGGRFAIGCWLKSEPVRTTLPPYGLGLYGHTWLRYIWNNPSL